MPLEAKPKNTFYLLLVLIVLCKFTPLVAVDEKNIVVRNLLVVTFNVHFWFIFLIQ